MPTFHIDTFGCQMNVADSELLSELLLARGFIQISDKNTIADLTVVNTCSVRENAERRAQVRIGEYVNKRKNKRQKIWVVGCMAQRMGNSLKEKIPGIDRVIGAEKLEHITHDIDGYLAEEFDINANPLLKKYGISEFLPVMRGCDNFCTYCIVPYVRGREHSMPLDEIILQAQKMVDNGVKEINLLGQNVNSYNYNGYNFSDLLIKLNDIKNIIRIRFTTSNPKDLTDRLIDTVSQLPKVCTHIHLPVQSGSSKILNLMNRKYTREKYLERVSIIRQKIPNVDLTTDVMVGFPGETDDDFLETLSLFETVRYTTAFMFAYSPRKGTTAFDMPNTVPEEDKKHRLTTLIDIQTKITKQHYADMVGKTVNVLFTQRQDKKNRLWMGQDFGCKRVLMDCDDDITGLSLDVKVMRSSGMTLICERV